MIPLGCQKQKKAALITEWTASQQDANRSCRKLAMRPCQGHRNMSQLILLNKVIVLSLNQKACDRMLTRAQDTKNDLMLQ